MRAFLTKPWVYRAFGVLTFFCTAAYLYLHQPWTAFWCGLVGLNSFTAAIQRETSDLKDMTISVLRERALRAEGIIDVFAIGQPEKADAARPVD